MAGNGQKKQEKKAERVVPGVQTGKSSRVSKAAGSVSSSRASVEQRSSPGGSRQRSKPNSNSGKRAAAGNKSTPKKSPMATPPPPADSRLISHMRNKWGDMQPHEQQRFFSILLLLLSLFLFLSLTFWRSLPLLKRLADFFFSMFSWASIPLTLGLIAFSIAHLIEGVRNIRFIRWSLVLGLLFLLILLLVESQLLVKGTTGGIIGGVLATPILGLSLGAHVLTLGLFLITALLTFRVTMSQLRATLDWLQQVFIAPRNQRPRNSSPRVSPFLGQRPRFSRYANGSSDTPSRKRGPIEKDEEDEEEFDAVIEFEDDFDSEETDPRNDINLHKQQISRVPKGPRPPQPLSPAELRSSLRGARQLPLPETPAVDIDLEELEEMEPLAPNPLHAQQPPPQPQPKPQVKVTRRGAVPEEVSSPWKQPDISLLNSLESSKLQMLSEDTTTLAKTIQDTLRSFRVEAEVRPEDISIGPTVIRFGIRPTGSPIMKEDEKGRLVPVKDSAGNIVYEKRTRVSRIMALQNDLALVLESKSIRMEAPVPGRPYVGVEIPNKNSRLVTLREVLESKEYQAARAKSKLTIALGKDVAGAVRVGDLTKMPHLLIAGATGSGKSVMINAIIASIITQATPDDARLLMVDPKMVELSMYNGIPHLLSPVVIEVEKVVGLLKVAITEMERRYRLFSQLGVRNLESYRRLRAEKIAQGDETLKNLPAIVIIIDELADLMMAAPEEVEGLICRLAQLARATGIHLVVATQRPSVDVITGLIKANIPTRISFMVSSAVDSRTIIDMGGAERLLGRGDMLYLPADAGKPERIQGAFVADEEAELLVNYWRQQASEHAALAQTASSEQGTTPSVEPGWEVSEQISSEFELEDDLLEQAEQVVQEYERASISLLQRRLRIGYSRAARLIDLLEERGVISKAESGGRSREVLEPRPASTRYSNGEGRSIADEAAEIVEEEKRRGEFLRRQAEREGANRDGK
jgi:DNA segregation ATPase FtsK/SpoIIIE-like protein